MMPTQRLAGSDPVTNAKYTIIRNHVEQSGAFDYNESTGNYTMNSSDDANIFNPGGASAGYAIYNPVPVISQLELDSNQFDDTTIPIQQFYVSNGVSYVNLLYLSKMQFFDLWLGMKLAPYSTGANPPSPSSYTGLDSLAENFSLVLHEPQGYFQSGGSNAQKIVASVEGGLNVTAKLGFPEPVSTSWWQGILNLANSLIDDFIDLVISAWNAICNIVGGAVDFVLGLWDNIVGATLGAAIEAVKSVVNVLFYQILNTIVQPMLSGQATSLSTLFNGESLDTIAANGQNVITNMGFEFDSQSSQLTTVGSSMQSLMSTGSVFSGSGTIVGQLIEITGPGIITTLFDLLSTIILNSLVFPLFSQFSYSDIQNDIDILTIPLGGTETATLSLLNDVAQISAVSQESGAENQHYGGASIVESSGTSDSNFGAGFKLDALTNVQLDSSSSSSSCGISDLSQCINDIFQWILSVGEVVVGDHPEGLNPIFNLIGLVLNALENLFPPQDQKYIILGSLSAFNNILGYLKTKVIDVVNIAFVQLIRLVLDFFQLFLSIHYYSSSTSILDTVSQLWFLKSFTACISDTLSFLDNFNDINHYFNTLMSMFELGNVWASYMTFKQLTNFLRASTSLISGIFTYFIYQNKKDSLTPSQAGWEYAFTIFYIIENIAKVILYTFRYSNIKILKFEQVIYITSAILNLGELGFTLAGIT